MKLALGIVTLSFVALFLGANAAITADLVTEFTNYTNLTGAPFQLYSGMLDISDAQYNKSTHYIFSTAFNNSAQAPVVLWLNGGPGCSSIGGWLSEIGPYLLFNDTNVHNNTNNTWNSIANLLYIESPIGVGFSTGNSSYNDSATTVDQYAALDRFFTGYPEFKSNPFYIAGESYAGIYIPNLAAYILKNTSSIVNLTGILVGNGVANRSYLQTGLPTMQFLYYHYLIPQDAYLGFVNNCKGPQESQTEPTCVFYTNLINGLTSHINPYGIYNYCYYSKMDPASGYFRSVKQHAPWYKFDSDSPCVTTYGAYLLMNNATVQSQLHVPNTTWNECSDSIFKSYTADPNGSLDAYAYLLNQTKVNVWVFSGDTDAVVPFTDTLNWINNFNLTITETWRAWSVNGQIGGFTQAYNGLRFVSVRGAGHMVPTDKPEAASVLFQTFLKNGTLPFPTVYGKTAPAI